MAGDGAATPLDGQAQHRLAGGATAIAKAANVLHTGELVGKPPLRGIPPPQKPLILRLSTGNIAGEGAKQQITQNHPQNRGKYPSENRSAEHSGNQPHRKIQNKQTAIQGIGAVAAVHKAGYGIAKTPKHRKSSLSNLSIALFRRGSVMKL